MKKVLMVLLTIILLTGCAKDKNELETNEKSYYAFGLPTTESSTNYQDVITSSGSNVLAKLEGEQLSICIYKDNTLECFKNNSYNEESVHIKNVFGVDNCNLESSRVMCSVDYFHCEVISVGIVSCHDYDSLHQCNLQANGRVDCF